MITYFKDDEGNKWYQFKAKDIDMLLPAMEDVKFEEITVTFHPNNPSNPVIIITEKKQLLRGTIIQSNFRKTNHSVAIINKNTPAPNTIISFTIIEGLGLFGICDITLDESDDFYSFSF